MKRQLSIFLFLLLFVFSISAQEKEARKFEEMDSTASCEIQWLVADNLFTQLQNDPLSTAFIIYYEGNHLVSTYKKGKLINTKSFLPRYGDANSRIQVFRDYIKLRRYDRDRILFINGGYRKEFTVEFWIVPKSADLPKPTPTLDRIKYRKGKPEWSCDY